jgi:hypothetical protein
MERQPATLLGVLKAPGVGPIRLLRVADLHHASSEPFYNFALGGTENMDLHIFLWIVISSSVVYGIWERLSEKAT